MLAINIFTLSICYSKPQHHPEISLQPTLRIGQQKNGRILSNNNTVLDNSSEIETIIDFKTQSFIQEYKISIDKIIKGCKIHLFNIVGGKDNNSVFVPDTEVLLDTWDFFPQIQIKSMQLENSNKFFILFCSADKICESPLVSYLKNFPEKAFKLSFMFSVPSSEVINDKVIKVIDNLEKTIQPLKKVLENQIRERVKAINDSNVADSLSKGKFKHDISEEIRAVIPFVSKSINMVYEINDYLNILQKLTGVIGDSGAYSRTENIEHMLKKKKEIGIKVFHAIKDFLKEELQKETKKTNSTLGYEHHILNTFVEEVEGYREDHFYLLTDIMRKLRGKTTCLSGCLRLETRVFRLKSGVLSLEEVFGDETIKLDRETRLC
ncbi:hypothetical protein CDIK_1712 [Cucumispora dikerogammari]|nr:hypothetical protein CDIK_1712 [Cucumispora dikerogammari]